MWLPVLVGITFAIACSARLLLRWRAHYITARATGLPCILIPAFPHAISTKLAAPLLFPVLKRLPRAWTDAWLPHLETNSLWCDGHAVFRSAGSDTYFLVAPAGSILVTCSPDAINQILHRREEFPRPVELFRAIGVWGPNLATSEGVEWRRQRKVLARAFGDRNNRTVWEESVYQAPQMLRRWAKAMPGAVRIRAPFTSDLMQMSMHIISKAGFGRRMAWEEGDSSEKASTEKFGLSYTEAGRGLAHNVLLVVGLPDFLLRFAPFAQLRQTRRYNLAFRSYMSEIIAEGRVRKPDGAGHNDILHELLRQTANGEDVKEDAAFSNQDILGNAFFLMLAGHETTATTMQLSLIYLATNPAAQKKVQEDLDRVLGHRAPESWTYDEDLPQLLEGMLGAVMMEELRLVPPVPAVAKLTAGPLSMTFDGLQATIPGNTIVVLNALGAHRNPKYWPHGPPSDPADPWHPKSNLDNDLEEFSPERWLQEKPSVGGRGFLQPQRGAYFPFSEGARSCLGRRFSQIEYAVVLATILQKYTVELDCREVASDEQVMTMNDEERQRVHKVVAQRTRKTIHADMRLFTTMLLKQDAKFPVRFVARGEEQFF